MTLPLLGPMSLTDFAHPWFFVFLLFIVGLWPAFGWLTPLVVVSQAMGSMMLLHFIPSCC